MSEQPNSILTLEVIPNDIRPIIASLIELSISTAEDYLKSPKITAFKIGGFDPLYVAATGLNLASWKQSLVKPAELLEQALALPPNKVLLGFRLRGSNWPIFDKDHGMDKEGIILDEPHVKEIYLALGGDKSKAEQIFPTPITTSQ